MWECRNAAANGPQDTRVLPDLTQTVVGGASVLVTPLDTADAAELAAGFAALADPVRLRVLSILAVLPKAGSPLRLRRARGQSQLTVPHHLKVLSDAGLVQGDRRDKWVWYSLYRDHLAHFARPSTPKRSSNFQLLAATVLNVVAVTAGQGVPLPILVGQWPLMEMRCADCGCLVDRGEVVERCGEPDCCCTNLPDKQRDPVRP